MLIKHLSSLLRVSGPLMLSCLFALFLAVPQSVAQSSDGENRRNEFGVWGAISFDATTWIGFTPDAKFGNVGLRYGRVLAANKNLAFSWTIDAIPVAVLSTQREHTYGAGLAPIGLKLNFRRSQMLQPFANGTGGFLIFTRNVPVPEAAQFNFTFDFGGGIDIVRKSGRVITIGYKYEHISNGYHAPVNPGVDVQMIYVGYSIRR